MFVIMIQPMTVSKIVQVHGAERLIMMSVMYVEAITHHVQIVQEILMEMLF